MKSGRLLGLAAGLAISLTTAANAVPTSQTVGPVTVDGTEYNVSVLGDSLGNFNDQSFNALSPTITFTTLASATDAGNALLAAYGTSFDWQPFGPDIGGRIAFSNSGGIYNYITLFGSPLPEVVNGPFSAEVTAGNLFTFIQFTPVSGVPEPFTLSLFSAGLFGAIAMRRRKKNVA
jgi:hypothetical protein